MKFFTAYIVPLLLVCSCFDPDETLPGVLSQNSILDLDLKFNQNVFVNLNTHSLRTNSTVQNWQLKFQNQPNEWSIYLNVLGKCGAHNTGITVYDSVTEGYKLSDVSWQLDVPTAIMSYPAIGTWGDYGFSAPQSYKNVYLLRWESNGQTLVYKLQILDAREGAYHIRYGSLNGSFVNSVWIPKNAETLHAYYSLELGQLVPNLEPPSGQWDICLTYLSDSLARHPSSPFAPTINEYYGIYPGLHVNQSASFIYEDTSRKLNEITFFNSNDLVFKPIDQLSNTLTKWDENSQQCVVNDKLVLLVKNKEGLFAIKPTQIMGVVPDQFSLTLDIKKL